MNTDTNIPPVNQPPVDTPPPPLSDDPYMPPEHLMHSSETLFLSQIVKVYETVPPGRKLDTFELRVTKAIASALGGSRGTACVILQDTSGRLVAGTEYHSISKCSVVLGLKPGTLSVRLSRLRAVDEAVDIITVKEVTVKVLS